MPYDLSLAGLLWMAIAILGAAFVRGYSGFGFSALVVAASGLVTNPMNFVAVVVICEAVMSLQAWRGIGPDIDWRRVGLLVAGAAIGLPLGLWAMTGLSEDAARIAISAYVLVMCGVLLMGWRMAQAAGGPATFGAGVVSGIANAPGMGGLPVAAFFAAQPLAPQVFRATLIAYFPILDIISAPLYWWHGLVTWDTLTASLLALPMVFLGNWLGGRHFFNTDPKDFRRFAIILLAGLAGLGLVKSVM